MRLTRGKGFLEQMELPLGIWKIYIYVGIGNESHTIVCQGVGMGTKKEELNTKNNCIDERRKKD